MSDWGYRYRMLRRDGGQWLTDHGRMAGMSALLALVVLVYVAFFLKSPFKTQEMVILHRRAPQWNSVVFNLDHDYPIRSIKVMALDEDGAPGETVWALKRDDAPALSTFAYGQQLAGMETTTPATPLADGATYRLVVKARGARGEVEFEFEQADPDAVVNRRRGG